MSRWLKGLLLVLILLMAAALRLTGLDWDAYHHYHPDERYIAWVATTIEWPQNWRAALRPSQSSFNPYYWPPDAASEGIAVITDAPRKFAYGHLPLYLGVAATRLVEWIGPTLTPLLPDDWLLTQDVLNGRGQVEFRHLTAVARALTALFDVGTVLLLFLLGRRLYNAAVGLLAAALLALNVMHIQLAHFFTADPYLTFFVVTAVYFMARGVRNTDHRLRITDHPRSNLLLAAVFVGLAVGSKFTAVLLLLPLTLAFWLWGGARWWWGWGTAVGIAFLTFAITNPFALLDFSCRVLTPQTQLGPITIPALNWRSCYLENVVTQGAMVRGDLDLPFTRQYQGTLPFLYPIEMQLRWGMGLLLGLVAFTGFAWAIWQAWQGLGISAWRLDARINRQSFDKLRMGSSISNRQLFITMAWALPFFLTTGGFYVKFMRYLQPLTPFLLLYGAALLLSWQWVWLRRVAVAVVLVGTGLYALSFASLYGQPHPWVQASHWIYAHVEPGALILSEQWDDPLPTTMLSNGELRRAGEYDNAELTWLTRTGEGDDAAKLQANLALLARADYLVLTSNRVYGVTPRLPEMFPLSHRYHQLLFAGKLGYEVIGVYGRFPHIGPLYLKSDTFGWPGLTPPPAVTDYLARLPGVTLGRADESFLVYDQPLTLVWRNVGGLTVAELAAQFVGGE